jgi:hypothetical protein
VAEALLAQVLYLAAQGGQLRAEGRKEWRVHGQVYILVTA